MWERIALSRLSPNRFAPTQAVASLADSGSECAAVSLPPPAQPVRARAWESQCIVLSQQLLADSHLLLAVPLARKVFLPLPSFFSIVLVKP